MSTRIIVASLFASTLFSPALQAEWEGGTGSSLPRENSSRYALHQHGGENGDSELLYTYSAKLYNERAPYDTQPGYFPVSTQTGYNGMSHEGQLISRRHLGNYRLDYVGGLGWDSWQRSINMNQTADYSVWFLRTAFSLEQPMQGAGFHGEGGLKLPFRTGQDAPLMSTGYSSNLQPSLENGVNLYAEVAYRSGKYWDIVGYYDSWHFKQADSVYTPAGSNIYSIVQPQSGMNTFGLKAMYSF